MSHATPSLRGVIFDWAGTLVDYGCLAPAEVFCQVFAAHGVAVTVAEARSFMGLGKKAHIQALLELPRVAALWGQVHGQAPRAADVDQLFAQLEPAMIRAAAHRAEPIPGVVETLAELRRRGLAVGSCTGYTRPMLEAVLAVAGPAGCAPDAAFCVSDVPEGRPAPWMCFLNAMALGAYPMAGWVKVGDTPADVAEGLNAGMWTVGISASGNEVGLDRLELEALPAAQRVARVATAEERLRQAGAHAVVASVAELLPALEDLQTRIQRGQRPL